MLLHERGVFREFTQVHTFKMRVQSRDGLYHFKTICERKLRRFVVLAQVFHEALLLGSTP